jgi:regulator of sirC expression with transglutaminase-like and TPR domain
MTGTAGEITALLNLIEDPDENVYQTVKSRIIEIGNSIIPALEDIKELEETPLQTERIDEIIAAILLKKLKNSIDIWQQSDEKSYLEIAFHIHEYFCSNAQKADFLFEIERIRKSIWLELNNYLTPLEEVNIFNKVLFAHFKFNTKELDYLKINDFDLGKLLKFKTSNTYPISVLYIILAEMLGIPIEPVSVPKQNLLAYIDFTTAITESNKQEIIFFIDPLSGQVYSHKDINTYISKINPAEKNILIDQNNKILFIKRWLSDLAKSEKENGFEAKYSGILEIIKKL